MRTKTIGFLLIALLLLVMLPDVSARANGITTLEEITAKKPGDPVTISGSTSLGQVTVKVVRPNQTVLYINVVDGPVFSDIFTLPADAMEGTYVVIAGQGTQFAAATFNVAAIENPDISRTDISAFGIPKSANG